MKKIFKVVLSYIFIIVILLSTISCKVKEKPKANEFSYSNEAPVIDKNTGAEDMSDVLKFVSKINYKNMNIPTIEELEKNLSLEEDIWVSLVENTEYKRMPYGYKDDFNLRKFLSVEYTYNMYINGLKGISWDDECKFVLEFLAKRIFEKIGV